MVYKESLAQKKVECTLGIGCVQATPGFFKKGCAGLCYGQLEFGTEIVQTK
jgi:hypothetical protein